MTTKNYNTPIVEVIECKMAYSLMDAMSTPTPSTTPGEKEYAPKREVF